MRKTLLICSLLLVASAPLASAQVIGSPGGVNFSWDDCAAAGVVAAKTFACGVNTGASRMVVSFDPSQQLNDFIGVEVVIDLQSDTPALPDWWQFFNTGSCRQNALNAGFDWSVLPSVGSACADPYEGTISLGGLAAYCVVGANCVDAPTDLAKARIKVGAAVADGHVITADTEYYAAYVTMTNVKTVGTGACAGCATGVTIVLNEVKAAGLSGPYIRNYLPMQNQCLTFNSGTVPCASLPARNTTWGQVKSLYR